MGSPRLKWLGSLGLLLTCSSALLSTSAHAQVAEGTATAAQNREQAILLFREARRQLDHRNLEQACKLFEQSLSLNVSPATLLNLGNCRELKGNLVAALSQFEEALKLIEHLPASPKADAWRQAAQRQSDSLLARIAHLTLRMAPMAGREIRLDNVVIEPAAQTGAILLNPGVHQLVATCLGHQDFTRSLQLGQAERLELSIPPLLPVAPLAADSPPLASLSTPPPQAETLYADSRSEWSLNQVAPWALIAAGGVTLGAAGVTGLMALSRNSTLQDDCPDGGQSPLCAPGTAGETEVNNLESFSNTVDILWIAGTVTSAVGVTWLLLGADSTVSTETVGAFGAHCGFGGCDVSVSGRF